MPAVFAAPAEKEALAAGGKTRYLAPRGVGTIMPGAEPSRMRDITDGTSNTDHCDRCRRRTRSGLDPARRLAVRPRTRNRERFQQPRTRWHHSVFADGVRTFIHARITAVTLRAWLTRDGNEVIRAEDL